MTTPSARVLDRGYRRYEGDRLGPRGAVRSLAVHSLKRALGMRRPFWVKLLPILTVLIAYLPAALFVGVAALLPTPPGQLPSYHGYYGFILVAMILFTALVAPEMLCTDRRSGVLGMYLASPLTRDTYLLAKAISLAAVLLVVTLGPPLVLLLGFVMVGVGPDGPGDLLLLILRMLASGAVLALFYGSLSLAVSSFTDRRGFASAGIILLLVGSGIATNVLREVLGAPEWVHVLNLGQVAVELVQRIYGQAGERDVAMATLVVAVAALTAASAWLVRWRYKRMDVSR